MTTTIVFFSSLLVAALLLVCKVVELKRGKTNPALACLEKFDDRSEKTVAEVKFKWLQLVQSIRYLVLVQAKIVCRDLLEKLDEKIRAKQIAIMTGQRQITDRGSASFYLKKISEYKGNSERGKIEESF